MARRVRATRSGTVLQRRYKRPGQSFGYGYDGGISFAGDIAADHHSPSSWPGVSGPPGAEPYCSDDTNAPADRSVTAMTAELASRAISRRTTTPRRHGQACPGHPERNRTAATIQTPRPIVRLRL